MSNTFYEMARGCVMLETVTLKHMISVMRNQATRMGADFRYLSVLLPIVAAKGKYHIRVCDDCLEAGRPHGRDAG